MSRRILQFGTSRFLQAHADLFVHEAREAGQDVGPVTIVKTTRGGARDGRVHAFSDPAGYPVRIQGFDRGRTINETRRVKSVARGLDASVQWDEVTRVFCEATEIVFSNSGDAGYAIEDGDRRRPAPGEAPQGFPAKLLALLMSRHAGGAAPLLVLPCELISHNGAVLRGLLEGLAEYWRADASFKAWLRESVTICDTLVDRIVSEAIEPIGAVAEPYAIWAIQRAPGMIEPFQHPNVVYTEDLEPYLRLKLHILNLGHTYIAEIWRREGRAAGETVRALLADAGVRGRLLSLYEEEILPGFAARGLGERARGYVAATLERFDNPFLDHRVSDIFGNHGVKVERRARDFIEWVHGAAPGLMLPRLATLAEAPAG